MKLKTFLSVLVIFGSVTFLLARGEVGIALQKEDKATKSAVERGKYLVTLAGCHDCHTPKKMGPTGFDFDMDRALSGHPANEPPAEIPEGVLRPDGWMGLYNFHLSAWVGPWGVSFAANLTPDEATGLGSWDEKMFMQAIRTGKHMGEGRDILPPMPWFNYAEMTDDDLKAVFAYLRSLKPIENPVPDPIPPMGKH